MNNLPLSNRVHGRCPPQSKSECEVIMMVGLPGAGKTYFAERYVAERREKQYNILGTNLILDKMKVMGLARQRNYHGRWDVLIDKSTKCLNTLISLACMRRRNYILDQTNVYPSAQRRKMRPFEGFKRKAIVIVPTDEEFRRRIAQREKEEGKEVPETAVLEMKANFSIPRPISEDSSSVFDEVIFTELGLDDAKTLVAQYNQEGQANRQPPEKRQRWDGGNRDRDDSRNSRFRGRDGRDRGRDMGRGRRDDFRNSPGRRNDDRGRRDYRGGYNASRDRSREGDRFDRNSERESFGRQSGGRFGGGPPGGRFGAPPSRAPFPGGMAGPGGFGAFDGSRSNMMRSGPGRGGFPPPNFDSRGGRSGGYRGSMERGNVGGYGGPNDSMYGHFDGSAGDGESMVNAYDVNDNSAALSQPGYEGGPVSGGFRGGYGGAGRGVPIQGSRGAPNRGGAPMGRGTAALGRAPNADRGVDRGQPGRNAPVTGRSGQQSDRDMGGGFSDESKQYGMYSGAEGYSNATDESFSGPTNDYRNRRFGGTGPYGASAMQKPSAGGYPPYQRSNPPFPPSGPAGYPNAPGGYSRTNAPSYGNPSSGSNYSSSFPGDQSGFTNTSSDPYGGGGPSATDMSGNRSSRSAMHQNPSGPFGGAHAYGSNDPDKTGMQQGDQTGSDGSSLYASGAARYSDNRPPVAGMPTAPRQSRFDTKPESNAMPQPNAYANYGMGSNYAGGFTNAFPSNVNQKSTSLQTPNPSGGPRGGRSRFDAGPPTPQPAPSATPVQSTPTANTYNAALQSQPANRPQPPTQMQSAVGSAQQPQQPQSYGYGYSAQGAKPDAGTGTSVPPPISQSYNAYNYGYGYSAYGAQATQQSAAVSRPTAPASGPTQSLYASAVAEKPQPTQQTSAPATLATSVSTTTAASDHSASVAAYASYYYGAPPAVPGSTQGSGKYDAAMAVAQQFNAWQQQQQPSAVSGSVSSSVSSAATVTITPQTPAANPYASYYPGYSTYPSGYSAMPVGGTAGSMPAAAAPPAPTMSQYYTGYR